MYAFAQEEVWIYNIPRYGVSSGDSDPIVLYKLQPGDRVLISSDGYPGANNPTCMRHTYFWYVSTAFEAPKQDPGIEGWVFEYHYYHSRDRNDPIRWDDGYFLGPYPP
jgi:hypothetical protein